MKLSTILAVATCCVALAGCTGQALKEAQSSCESFGFSPGSDSYARCVRQDAAMREGAVGQPIGFRAKGLATATDNGAIPGVPVLYATYVSDSNRVCMYNQSDYEVDTTVPVGASCPHTLQ
jgi:hypothetical protein